VHFFFAAVVKVLGLFADEAALVAFFADAAELVAFLASTAVMFAHGEEASAISLLVETHAPQVRP
jgi:hypothetical protein